MTKKDILNWFNVNNAKLDGINIVFLLCVAILVASIIFITYKITYSGVCYNAKFNMGNVVILLITTVVMLMISSNIAISLGMVGALSIVRFRTAIKDPQDTIYIFWSIVEGLCVGAQMFKLSFISTFVIAIVLVGTSFYVNSKRKYLIIVRGNGNIETSDILDSLRKEYKNSVLKSANYNEVHSELIFEISIKGEINFKIIDDLRKYENVSAVNWLLEMGEHIG